RDQVTKRCVSDESRDGLTHRGPIQRQSLRLSLQSLASRLRPVLSRHRYCFLSLVDTRLDPLLARNSPRPTCLQHFRRGFDLQRTCRLRELYTEPSLGSSGVSCRGSHRRRHTFESRELGERFLRNRLGLQHSIAYFRALLL